LRVEVLREFSCVGELEAPWRELWDHASSPSVFLHPLWAVSWWNHYGQAMEPCIVLVWDESGSLAGLAPLCWSQKAPGVMGWIGDTELSDTMDFLVRSGKEVQVMGAMDRALRKLLPGEFQLDLHCVPDGSPTLEELNEMLSQGWDVSIELEEFSPRVELPASWEEFLEGLSAHHRHEIRRKMRKADKDLATGFVVVEPGDGWDRAMEHFFRLHRLSQPQKAAFMDDRRESFFCQIAEVFGREGMVRLSELRSMEGPIASSLSFVQGRTWALYNSGFDPRYRQYSPGIVLVAHTIRQAISENLTLYDFLRGREIYKYDFGASDHLLYRLRLSPRPEGKS
jgi:CelD/BcsL family acetyltransferase involved in cellulose biosynthesis